MAFRVGLHNFSKGVLSEELKGRQDVEAYNAGMARCANAYILKQGGVTGRPGTRVVYQSATSEVRLIPFEVSQDQTYMMLLEQASMKPMFIGGMVLEDELAVAGITKAAEAVVTIQYHDLLENDELYIIGQQGMTQINGRTVKITGILSTHTFRINVNSTNFSAWTGSTGGITRAGPPTPLPAPPTVPAPATPPAPPPVAPGAGGGDYSGLVLAAAYNTPNSPYWYY